MSLQRIFNPTKRRPPGSVAGMVSRAVSDLGGLKGAAHVLGRSVSSVAGYTDPDHPPRITVAQALAMTRAGTDGFALQFAAAAGGTFVPGTAPSEPFPALAGNLAVCESELMQAIITAQADGEVSPAERTEIIVAIDRLSRACVHLRASLAQSQGAAA